MNYIWRRDGVTVREVVDVLGPQRGVAYTTVMTVMNRLVDQKLLRRQPLTNGAYRYAASLSREDYSIRASRHTVDELLRHYGDAALVQFLNTLDQVPEEKLAKLRRRLRQAKS